LGYFVVGLSTGCAVDSAAPEAALCAKLEPLPAGTDASLLRSPYNLSPLKLLFSEVAPQRPIVF
jgi:hypothetical protein